MTEPAAAKKYTHREFAVSCFNQVWELLDKPLLSELEKDDMVHLCHASFWHWAQVPKHTETNLSIGYWQLARVYAVLEQGENALRYARKCMEVSLTPDIPPFYQAYAYEAEARAYAVSGLSEEAAAAMEQARLLADLIEEAEDREALLRDLNSIS